ncbi:MAG TPA: L-threonylcarbamoyladenylate synthase [Bacteroidales bacterium]|jgi:tRNA threonylcarbamoyl adenosine modification protein (Sua5/YciO/YrdC/YwlC family)|nr:threonylcarbamoyl-AMP synthase [Bacteroidales bacterium]HNR27871.1 L-threonylcarbamoyladenylate synthase [Bacteroidales bacterium]HOD56769.1 L-threonylcarbamoyladenylate synthase [Bacteroidales bacterium]HOF76101.1 L-threonylcarbamoyladenylate synthase [Bacteroidales bacterium]HOQ96660.1 L-threonylcarbamoyladenylate synthase [Bacteroidales bacterium]
MYIRIYPNNPQDRLVQLTVATLQKGGIVIYPTDSVYGMGCSIEHLGSVPRMERIKGYYTPSTRLSFLCYNLSQVSNYCRPVSNAVFRLIKKNLPGPFTFLLQGNSRVPRLFKGKKQTVGIRVPDNPILQVILRELAVPIISTSLPWDETEPGYSSDPDLINERFGELVDIVIDGGPGGQDPSAIIDCTGPEPVIIRGGPKPLLDR